MREVLSVRLTDSVGEVERLRVGERVSEGEGEVLMERESVRDRLLLGELLRAAETVARVAEAVPEAMEAVLLPVVLPEGEAQEAEAEEEMETLSEALGEPLGESEAEVVTVSVCVL